MEKVAIFSESKRNKRRSSQFIGLHITIDGKILKQIEEWWDIQLCQASVMFIIIYSVIRLETGRRGEQKGN